MGQIVGHVCKLCGHFAGREHCGVKKLVEYDNTKILTIIYEGKHNCLPKPNWEKKENYRILSPMNKVYAHQKQPLVLLLSKIC